MIERVVPDCTRALHISPCRGGSAPVFTRPASSVANDRGPELAALGSPA